MGARTWSVCAVFLVFVAVSSVQGADKYGSYAELAKNEQEGVDYRVRTANRPGSRTLIMAIHGGKIERYTSELTLRIAGSTDDYYLFEGLKSRGNRDLHITSTKFDEPRALALVSSANTCVSLHGFAESSKKQVCVGGRNTRMVQKFLAGAACKTNPFEIVHPCTRFPGASTSNIVNMCSSAGGLQLELSTKLRDTMKSSPGSTTEEARLVELVEKTLSPDAIDCSSFAV